MMRLIKCNQLAQPLRSFINNQNSNFRKSLAVNVTTVRSLNRKVQYSSVKEWSPNSDWDLNRPVLNREKEALVRLASTKFYCQDYPLIGASIDGTFNNWSKLPHLTKEQFESHNFWEASQTNKTPLPNLRERYFNPLTLSIEVEIDNVSEFNGDSVSAVTEFLEQGLRKVELRRRPTINNRRYLMTSVLRKRKLKMNKHKYNKLRKRSRALRKRLNK